MMVTYDFTDLSTGESMEDPDTGTYSIMELNREHLIRYVMMTSKGAIILRHMPLRLKRVIDSAMAHIYPDRPAMVREASDIAYGLQDLPPEEYPEDDARRMTELSHTLAITDMSALGVIVAPALASMDDYETLYESLTEREQITLSMAVNHLSTVRRPSTVDSTVMEIAKAHGMKLMTPEMLELMTVSQAAYYVKRIEQENRAVQRMMGRETKRVV